MVGCGGTEVWRADLQGLRCGVRVRHRALEWAGSFGASHLRTWVGRNKVGLGLVSERSWLFPGSSRCSGGSSRGKQAPRAEGFVAALCVPRLRVHGRAAVCLDADVKIRLYGQVHVL